ncbi:MAG: VWA domain-containing protein, partial [Thermomicrobiales bacterium]|nr:VWA domain-containing protein [Thermomicrobiales bacterium]
DQFWTKVQNTAAPVEYQIPDPRMDQSPPEPSETQQGEASESTESQQGEASEDAMMAIEDTGDAAENAPDAEEDMEAPPDDVMVFSAREVLRKKDFSQFSADEIAEARRMIESMTWRLGTRKTRRLEPSNAGDFFDYRRTLRASMKYKGVPINLKRRERKDRMRPLILICDISGSMDRYSRLLLRFVHALEHGLDTVEVFVFSTRL